MRNPHGYGQVFCDDPKKTWARQGNRVTYGKEHDTFRCGHCMTITIVAAKERPEDIGGMCYQCMRLVCPKCVVRETCDPLEEKLKRVEKTGDFRRWFTDALR